MLAWVSTIAVPVVIATATALAPVIATAAAAPRPNEVVWAGIDFSMTKMVGSRGFRDAEEIFPRLLLRWNELVLEEKLGDLRSEVGASVVVDLKAVSGRNRGASGAQIVDGSVPEPVISDAAISQAVKSFSMSATKGTGLVFFMDRMDKPAERACMHVTFFDLSSRKVLSSELQCAGPRGFGIRNYWFGAVKRVIEQLDGVTARAFPTVYASAPSSRSERGSERPGTKSRDADRRPAPSPAYVAPPAAIQPSQGRHVTLKDKGLRCAAMPIHTEKKLAAGIKAIADELLLTELAAAGFEAIGPDDINAMAQLEKIQEKLACETDACAVQIGRALGVRYLAAGKLGTIDKTTVLVLKIIDVENVKVVARAQRTGSNSPAAFPQMMADAVQDLVVRTGL